MISILYHLELSIARLFEQKSIRRSLQITALLLWTEFAIDSCSVGNMSFNGNEDILQSNLYTPLKPPMIFEKDLRKRCF